MQSTVYGRKGLPRVLMSSVLAVSETLDLPEQLLSAIYLSPLVTSYLLVSWRKRKLSGGKMSCLPVRMVADTLALTLACRYLPSLEHLMLS